MWEPKLEPHILERFEHPTPASCLAMWSYAPDEPEATIEKASPERKS